MIVKIVSHPSPWGGAQLHTLDLAKALCERGHAVTIVSLGRGVYESHWSNMPDGVDLITLDGAEDQGLLNAMSVSELRRLFRPAKGDVCILVKSWFGLGNWKIDLVLWSKSRRYVTIEQLTPPSPPPRQSKRHIFGLIPGLGLWWIRRQWPIRFRSFFPSAIICVSSAVRDQLMSDYRYPARKLIIIHNGIDPVRFQPHIRHRRLMRRAWGIPDDALVFGAVGRLDEQKGYDLAIQSFQHLCSKYTDRELRLVLVGDGPQRASLTQMAYASGVGDKILLAGPTDSPWEAFNALDVFLMPSLAEGLSFSLLEAMACRCCPVAMGVGGVPEVIRSPELGWMVSPGDRRGFATAMCEALSLEANERFAMGCRAREVVVRCFNVEYQMKSIDKILEEE